MNSAFIFPGAQAFTPGDLTPEGSGVGSANPAGPATGQPAAVANLQSSTPILGVIAVVLLVLYLERRRIKRGIK